ncbi:hypothetical protein U1Q18_035282 [Sarracenia purpurea var. burkii]
MERGVGVDASVARETFRREKTVTTTGTVDLAGVAGLSAKKKISSSALETKTNSDNDFIQESTEGSDSNANDDDFLEYYQPISTSDDHDEGVSDPTSSDGNSDDESEFPRLANGYANRIGNGISSIALSDDEERKSNEEEEEAGEE